MTIACTDVAQITLPASAVHVRTIHGLNAKGQRPQWRTRRHVIAYTLTQSDRVLVRNADRAGKFEERGPITIYPNATAWEADRYADLTRCVSLYLDADKIDLPACGLSRLCCFDDATMIQMMKVLYQATVSPRADSPVIVSSVGDLLGGRVSLSLKAEDASPAEFAASPGQLILTDVVAALERLGYAVSPDEIASFCGMSRRNLLRKVRASCSLSTSQFIGQRRIEKAKLLLAWSPSNLKRTAFEAGYASASEFSTRFKAATGLTPTEFRRSERASAPLIAAGSGPASQASAPRRGACWKAAAPVIPPSTGRRIPVT